MDLEKILIVGAGNGGQAAAVDLTSRGFKVCLYEFPEFSDKLQTKLKTQSITAEGILTGGIKIDLITTDVKKASEYSKTVLVTMPAFGHQHFISTFKDDIQEDSRVYFFPGNLSTLLTLEMSNLTEKGISLVEFNSLPYGCRIKEDGTIKIGIKNSLMTFAAFPAIDTEKVVEEVEKLYPGQEQSLDILEVALSNPNPLIHPPGVLLNIGRIEHSDGNFYMYNEGMTPSILKIIESVDKERQKIAEELSYKLIAFSEFGGILVDGRKEHFITCGEEALMLGPCNRNNRYLTEDVPYGLVYWSEIGKKLGIETPHTDAIITMTSSICDLDFSKQRNYIRDLLPDGSREMRRFLYRGKI
ncbi:hypothetical protein HN681_02685 [archaeon]|jgi:opine dehydrogenase|nr:hypothetical protein [archaeon]MBT3731176.1 hypothetical protein [archaeon]MBT4670070.1 hypothetical protein [archaeon]MBT5030630.1 hypothetical protein [archaeon]MBT5287982.1 hypothetical protein [archaeon]